MFETFHIAGTIPEEREGLKMSATGSVSWRVKLYEGLLASQWTLKSFLDMSTLNLFKDMTRIRDVNLNIYMYYIYFPLSREPFAYLSSLVAA